MSKNYEIRAYMICHDVKLATYVSTHIEAEEKPGEAEAADLLVPAVEEALRQRGGTGCQYELSNLTIQ